MTLPKHILERVENKAAEQYLPFYSGSSFDQNKPLRSSFLEGAQFLWGELRSDCWGHRHDLILELAKTIYHNYHGLDDEDYKIVTGKERKPWVELEQHEWDDYRGIASAVHMFYEARIAELEGKIEQMEYDFRESDAILQARSKLGW